MTEEIINSVDVSGCRFFIKEYIEDGYTEDDGCVYIKNACGINGTECCIVAGCYYKQLKGLKKTLEDIKNICKPILKVDNIEILEGKHLTGKYNLAKEIMEVLKNEY